MKTYKELQEDLESRRAEASKQSASRTSGFTGRSRKEMKDNRGESTPSSSGGNPEPKLAPLFRQTTKEISKGIVKKLLGKGKKKNKNKEEPKSTVKSREPFKPKTGAAAGVPFKPKTKKVEKPEQVRVKVEKPEQKKPEQKKPGQKRLPPKPEQKRLPPASD